jgi:thioester reductase-like protein
LPQVTHNVACLRFPLIAKVDSRIAMTSIIDYLEHWAAIQPEKLFIAFLDVDGNETESYSYLGFHERTRHLAEYLLWQVGLKRGDRALLIFPPGLELIAAFFACARIGVISVPVNPPTPAAYERGQAKLLFVGRDCQAATALTTADFYRSHRLQERPISPPYHDMLGLQHLNWVTTDNVRGLASDRFRNDPGRVLFLQYTSGSTSDPKGVIVSHENVIHNGRSTLDHTGIGVSWLPQYHDMGLVGYYLFPLLTGSTTYGCSPLDFLKRPLLWLQTISRVRATYASSPNFGFAYCLREDRVPSEQLVDLDLSSLRVLMNAAEPVSSNTYLRFLRRFAPYGLRPRAHVAAYGLAENTLAATHYGRRIVRVNKRLLQEGKVRIEDVRPPNNTQLRLVSCGQPLSGIHLRIVRSQSRAALGEREIGEIWLAGKSTCQGYWKRPDLTREIFENTIANDPEDRKRYLRTGDLGFLHKGELFVCGRLKDLIIVRGVNYYPQDVEHIVESASGKIRTGGVAAFNGLNEEEGLVVVAEVRRRKDLPDAAEIARAIRTEYYIEPKIIVFLPAGAVAKTSSGKIARSWTRRLWLRGQLPIIATHVIAQKEGPASPRRNLRGRFRCLLEPYNLTGNEAYTLAEIGLDSLTLVMLTEEVLQLLQSYGVSDRGTELDTGLIQRLTVADFFCLLDQIEMAVEPPIAALREVLQRMKREHESNEQDRMRSDARLEPINRVEIPVSNEPLTNVLLTGPTGFFGPFLLNSLLKFTPYTFYALTRAADPAHGLGRIRASLRRARLWTEALERELDRRVHVVPGDISKPNLGLDSAEWKSLTTRVQAVLHNAALVNYVLNYDALRPHNVDGTRELLRFSFTGTLKEFHFISSTIVFGWTAKTTLVETDNNDSMENLDFGYAQSKWVAEQLVLGTERHGLKVCIYRPSFISVSSGGAGSAEDIAILLLAFMINHGIAVRALNQISFLPADIAADNIAFIFGQAQTAGRTFHVTVDDYYNMMDITQLITRDYGYPFVYLDIPDFVAEMKRRCTKADRLYPLLNFLDQSHAKIAAMQHKRYQNDQYRRARRRRGTGRDEPELKDTVSYLMAYMLRQGIIHAKSDWGVSVEG